MINKKVEEAFNIQINAELYSAYLYLSMAAYFEAQNLPGFANWMRVQFQEEQFHAMKMFDYVNERGGRVVLTKIDGPKVEWENVVDVFAEVLSHEQHVTSLINNIMDIAIDEKDHATRSFLNWFVDEQVEEEANAEAILADLKLIDGKGNGIMMMNREFKTRVFNPAAE
ncbi:ferritin [Acidaminobacter hydrogenoformans]|uniref:Ferritin n=1 Tax=Acidaminobacter hydrogenoformans DSM 2784 TaxID=1120920 RepID=A0A1G5RZ94_9FIRM|nr:ferritin [Acidaminobacter hydrogenoformans]SCZ79168.1 ferritin [Acidaminobacter hydrogenoformans DSM 2784]